jgi:hypothetical protein
LQHGDFGLSLRPNRQIELDLRPSSNPGRSRDLGILESDRVTFCLGEAAVNAALLAELVASDGSRRCWAKCCRVAPMSLSLLARSLSRRVVACSGEVVCRYQRISYNALLSFSSSSMVCFCSRASKWTEGAAYVQSEARVMHAWHFGFAPLHLSPH